MQGGRNGMRPLPIENLWPSSCLVRARTHACASLSPHRTALRPHPRRRSDAGAHAGLALPHIRRPHPIPMRSMNAPVMVALEGETDPLEVSERPTGHPRALAPPPLHTQLKRSEAAG